jgi:thiosulfate reductase cytochrome b subunit
MDTHPDQQGVLRGVTTVLGHDFDTTGVLGLSCVPGFGERERGFPAWATLPGMQWLAMGRRWHFFFAWIFIINGLVYLTSGLASGHFRRDLLPTGEQLRQSAAPSGTTCGCASLKGRRLVATTCCRNWLTWR